MSNPIEESAFRYRIVYDALVRFSCNINRCESITEVAECFQTDMKYLFDCVALRLCITNAGYLKIFCFGKKRNVCDTMPSTLFYFEEDANTHTKPLSFKADISVRERLNCYLPSETLECIESIWVWPFTFNDNYRMTATVFSDDDNIFKSADIPILKIICESFFSKIHSLMLFEEVNATKNELQKALKRVESKNNEIVELLNQREMVIQQRTELLKLRNNKLSEIVRFNAHNIREPLTRIAGLLELTKITPEQEVLQDLLPMLVVTADDLDNALKNAITYIESE